MPGSALDISERTVNFMDQTFSINWQLDDRRGLSPDKFAVKALAARA